MRVVAIVAAMTASIVAGHTEPYCHFRPVTDAPNRGIETVLVAICYSDLARYVGVLRGGTPDNIYVGKGKPIMLSELAAPQVTIFYGPGRTVPPQGTGFRCSEKLSNTIVCRP